MIYKNKILYSNSYAPPLLQNIKSKFDGLCIIEGEINDAYREESLFYIQINGYISNEQAQPYIPSIVSAWNQYYTPLQANLSVSNAKIIAKQYRFNNFNIITRIYYQVFSNYSIDLDGFNYQGKLLNLLNVPIGSPSLVLGRNVQSRHASQRKLHKKSNFDVVLDQLPQIQVENELKQENIGYLESALQHFWTKSKNK